ncbi:3-mercaptopyruvate sulfurtransferase SseA, contains two rhodanese domains [Tindallia magadiensis]|uniref:3-mercaptopyruvate sulfurtransferase SseA, contains two rhodanese domains n=2 Tax=Tindallia magadiensis TaxID=69895 RepID=A0A1I3E549_9FIRM|nr:3-mercaptopyruvate sulfurtransferase SseA, contains two rhodanese domains [Tindallia magadiensis]
MMSQKKLLSLLLALLLSLSLLAGCGSPAEEAEEVEEPVVEEVVEEPADESEEESELDRETVIREATAAYYDSITEENSTWNMISFENALPLIEENPEDYFIVDMRSADDYAEGHIPGAVHIPYAEIGDKMDVLPDDRQILVYCFTGQTSGQAIAAMQLMGFDALSLQGGMNFGWAPLELGEDTLETEANELPAADANWTPEQEILLVAIHNHFTQGTNYIVRPPEVKELIEAGSEDIEIIDIRNQEAYDEGHIEGAILIPFPEIGERMDEISTEKPVYVTCFSGQTAGQTILNLRLNGIDAMSLYRGMRGWTAEEMPVVTP